MKSKLKTRMSLFKWVVLIVLTMYAISLMGPLFWGLITSLKKRMDFVVNPLFFPKKWMFINYINVFKTFKVDLTAEKSVYLPELLLNSIIYVSGTVALSTFIPCMVAYLVAKYRYRFSKLVYNIVLITLLLPIAGGTLPSAIRIYTALGIFNTPFALYVGSASFLGTSFLIFYGSFKSVSWEYAEAAFIDGASHARVMFMVMFPLVKTTIGILALLSFIGRWNDYMGPMVFWRSGPTAAYGMFWYSVNPLINSVPEQITGCMIFVLPIIVLFLIFQNRMMGNLTMGGLKG